MLLLMIFIGELSRTSSYIDIPTPPQYDIAGMYGGGLMTSLTMFSDDPDLADDQFPDPADLDLFFRYGFGRGEVSLSAYAVNTYVISVSYLLAPEKNNAPAFFCGIDDISYNPYLSTVGMKKEKGFIEEYNYGEYCGGRPPEIFSTYLAMQKHLGSIVNFVIGLGRGRFVGYGDRSHFFNTDIFVLGSDFKRSDHSAWAIGLFFGGSLKFKGGLELSAEMDGRDANLGMKYHHQYFTATLGIAKFEQMRWWNKAPYSPRIIFGIETDNRAALEAPKVGKIECIAQDLTTKQLLPNSIVDIKEINKRYKAISGTFSMSLPAGNYTITVSRPSYIDYIAKIIVKPGVKSKLIFNLKKTEEALKKANNLQAVQTLIQQGKIYYSEGNMSLAKQAFDKALAIDPNNIEAKNYLVNIENRRNELIASYANEAKQKEKAKDFTKAVQYWQKVLELDPNNAEAKTAIAALQKKTQPEKKPTSQTKPPVAKKATKEEIDALYNKGVSYFTAEKYEDALKVFKQVITLDPTHKGATDYKKRTEARIKALKGG